MNTVFKALNDATRREIIEFLKKGDLTAGEIADHFQITRPGISHHLDLLKQAGLVASAKQGQFIYYSLNTTVVDIVLHWALSLKKEKLEYMKTTNKIINTVVLLLTLSPVVYLLVVWKSVPEKVITRFNFNEIVAKEQSRETMLLSVIAVSIIGAGMYLLMRNLKKIDPKVTRDTPTSGFNRIGLAATIFLVLVNCFYVLSARHSWEISQKVLFIFLGLLIAVVGNYMYNIKPNYFAGIRLPWTLNDENNWRQTHHLAGKLLFLAGLLLALISGFLPEAALKPVFISTVVLIIIIPGIYSYRLFKRKK